MRRSPSTHRRSSTTHRRGERARGRCGTTHRRRSRTHGRCRTTRGRRSRTHGRRRGGVRPPGARDAGSRPSVRAPRSTMLRGASVVRRETPAMRRVCCFDEWWRRADARAGSAILRAWRAHRRRGEPDARRAAPHAGRRRTDRRGAPALRRASSLDAWPLPDAQLPPSAGISLSRRTTGRRATGSQSDKRLEVSGEEPEVDCKGRKGRKGKKRRARPVRLVSERQGEAEERVPRRVRGADPSAAAALDGAGWLSRRMPPGSRTQHDVHDADRLRAQWRVELWQDATRA